ncbi:MAG TPA: ATP-dependent Clp protease proteolytic subunit [Candidatus Akkermansia intestinigallinarum]|uniref:ATP-dependent Clp protease proteolytic subunit n=1 Tax=Candidatus Akkermansia intestinigallinarum TaxID=2838431 RepID=A0A9D2AHL7_9BACT|nr:ATP-dependent Clp protease proteolytic subunit [Candidatus Akkermansia intestinigallinarum]
MTNPHNDLVVLGSINDSLLSNLTRELQLERYSRHVPLRLFISSPGGSTAMALTMSRLLLSLFEHIETYNLAIVDSAAVCLFLIGSKRSAFAGSRFFLHPATLAFNESLTETQILENLRLIRSDRETMLHFYRERTRLDEAAIKQWFDVPTSLSGSEALAQGLATDLCDNIPDFAPRYLNSREEDRAPVGAAGPLEAPL